MPKRILYDINIYDKVYREKNTRLQVEGTVEDLQDVINHHFGLKLVSKDIINNILNRRDKLSSKYLNIFINRYNIPTKTYQNGVGGKYPSSLTL